MSIENENLKLQYLKFIYRLQTKKVAKKKHQFKYFQNGKPKGVDSIKFISSLHTPPVQLSLFTNLNCQQKPNKYQLLSNRDSKKKTSNSSTTFHTDQSLT